MVVRPSLEVTDAETQCREAVTKVRGLGSGAYCSLAQRFRLALGTEESVLASPLRNRRATRTPAVALLELFGADASITCLLSTSERSGCSLAAVLKPSSDSVASGHGAASPHQTGTRREGAVAALFLGTGRTFWRRAPQGPFLVRTQSLTQPAASRAASAAPIREALGC